MYYPTSLWGFLIAFMKYSRLTKEQFEALHLEFARFLAALGIDAAHWKQLKEEKSTKVEELLDVFSDQVWDDVLDKAKYLEHWSEDQVLLISCEPQQMTSVILKATNPPQPITTAAGWQWVQKQLHTEQVTLYQGTKKYAQARKNSVFEMIRSGAQLSNGKKYKALKRFF
jgi:hypothetical protein